MSGITYDALTSDEKREIARELRAEISPTEIAELMHVSLRSIVRWTRGMGKSRTSEPVAAARVLTDEDFCHCPNPARDGQADSFFRRGATCIYCTKPRSR